MSYKPTITPKSEVTITVQQQPDIEPLAGQWGLIAIDPAGNEKPGSFFSITPKGFDKHYKHLTEKPEGTSDTPQFRVKKNPNK